MVGNDVHIYIYVCIMNVNMFDYRVYIYIKNTYFYRMILTQWN